MQSHRVREGKEKNYKRREGIGGKGEGETEKESREKSDKLASGLCIWKTENLPNSLFFLPFMDLPVEGFG